MVRQAHHERVGTAMNGDNQPLTLSLSKGWCLSLAMVMALSLLALLMFPKPAHACMCGDSGSPREAMAKADEVFFGRVTGMTVRSRESGLISSADPVTVEFDVIRVWKGPLRETLTVETERMGISCGYEFKEGRRYIVYTWGGNRTGLCTRTAPVWLAARDFAALGLGRSPELIAEGLPTPAPIVEPAAKNQPSGGGCGNTASASHNPADLAPLALLAGTLWLGARRRRRGN